MQRIFSFGLATVAAIWIAQPIYAGSGGIGGSVGSGASVSAAGGRNWGHRTSPFSPGHGKKRHARCGQMRSRMALI